MKTQSFNQIMDDTIQNHWKNTLKMPVLVRDRKEETENRGSII